jgi:hypothetical protein
MSWYRYSAFFTLGAPCMYHTGLHRFEHLGCVSCCLLLDSVRDLQAHLFCHQFGVVQLCFQSLTPC